MHLPEYAPGVEAPLVDAMPWLGDELFWPAFLVVSGSATAPGAFGVDPADLEAILDDFERPEQWPVFTVPVAGGTLHLVHCNLVGDTGISWRIDDGVRAAMRRVADAHGGAFPGPGLPWSLLPAGPTHLLLALPAFGDAWVPDHVPPAIEAALHVVGATTLVAKVAEELIEGRAALHW